MKTELNTIWIDLNEELYAFILGRIKDEHIAKDIHQEVFLKVQTKIHQLKRTSKLTSWVYQITRNSIIDHYRKSNNKTISINDMDFPEVDSENFEYANLTNCINQKIEDLSSHHKEAIILTSFRNYSQKELAQHLNISYSGTKSRVQKAKEILKENILDCPNVASDNTGKLIDFEKK
ncbi:sigma-70 family RNA polymerase sigma factor [Maribacter sp. 1_2014MBL_MicDiv]|uniref:sigma-70 family RNA polymerase sigma factor n=1 Tax=Maribacter sp. 1_2014MBL_MicDiv TaxID=1644130 RepID=UPI0008F4A992|nr:sigma-70 family RNA polymerase sigma factor [Maribacter sp. 1_2014MBL_MicDiv]APA63011.1 RNA polymerase sigma factor [Maribacter sp. 1_2014MBL_MicDiv]